LGTVIGFNVSFVFVQPTFEIQQQLITNAALVLHDLSISERLLYAAFSLQNCGPVDPGRFPHATPLQSQTGPGVHSKKTKSQEKEKKTEPPPTNRHMPYLSLFGT
jgi:hypothetical protein